jgi:Tfp pilus assembly protein PilF
MLFALGFSACGGSGPKQAEGPKPNLDDTSGGGGTSSGGNDKPVAPEIEAAQDAVKNNDCTTATAKAKAVLDKDKDSADAHFILGVCLEKDDKKDDAWKEYDAALKIDPHHLSAATNESALLIDLGKFDEAVAVCKAALVSNKGAVDLHINLGYALAGKGDHADAAKSFKNALALKPDDATLMVARGNELAANGDKDEAAKSYKNALAKTDDAELIGEAAVGLGTAGDPQGCVAALDKAIAKASSSKLLADRGICKHKAGDVPGARKDLDDALAADATNVIAQFAAAKYAEEAKDKKACKEHWAAAAKLVKGEAQDMAKKGEARCSK